MKISIDTLRKKKGESEKYGFISVDGYHFFFCNEVFVGMARLKDTMRCNDGKVYLFWEIMRSELISSEIIEYRINRMETKERNNASRVKNYFCYKDDSHKYKEEIPYRIEIIINNKRVKRQ